MLIFYHDHKYLLFFVLRLGVGPYINKSCNCLLYGLEILMPDKLTKRNCKYVVLTLMKENSHDLRKKMRMDTVQ